MTKARDIASATTPNANAALLATFPHRNLIINGAMQVSQRGTSSTGVTTATYLVDRFQGRTTSGSIDLSQSTTAPAGFSNSFKLAVNTTNAFGTASDEAYFEQIVEAQNLQHLQYGLSTAQKITLSFWVRSSVAGTYGIWFYQDDATKDYEVSYTIDSADTWEKKSVTVDGNTADAIDNNNESGMRVRWYLDGGSDRRGTISSNWATSTSTSTRLPTGAPAWMNGSNDFYLTGIQLELGEQATPFEHENYGATLRKCQRYLYRLEIDSASVGFINLTGWNTNDAYGPILYPVKMRTAPTLSYGASLSDFLLLSASSNPVPSNIYSNGSAKQMMELGFTSTGNIVAGRSYWARITDPTNGFIQWDAEL